MHDNDNKIDFREPHNSGVAVSLERLAKLGIVAKYLEKIDDVELLAKERNYKNRDTVKLSKKTFNNDETLLLNQLNIFYQEHLHEDEEIRYCIEGSGYFDIKDTFTNEWIRCKVSPGDLLIVPAGIYHRFTLTTDNFIKALRLFKDEPKWQAHNKSGDTDQMSVRKQYLESIGN